MHDWPAECVTTNTIPEHLLQDRPNPSRFISWSIDKNDKFRVQAFAAPYVDVLSSREYVYDVQQVCGLRLRFQFVDESRSAAI